MCWVLLTWGGWARADYPAHLPSVRPGVVAGSGARLVGGRAGTKVGHSASRPGLGRTRRPAHLLGTRGFREGGERVADLGVAYLLGGGPPRHLERGVAVAIAHQVRAPRIETLGGRLEEADVASVLAEHLRLVAKPAPAAPPDHPRGHLERVPGASG